MRRGLLSDWLQCVRFLDWWAELVMIQIEMSKPK